MALDPRLYQLAAQILQNNARFQMPSIPTTPDQLQTPGQDVQQPAGPAPADGSAPPEMDTTGATKLNALAYGPVVGEYGKSQMIGAYNNPLGPKDVAISPQLLSKYPLGSSIVASDKQGKPLGVYNVADTSYYTPGNPTKNTIEFRDRDISNKPVYISPTGTPAFDAAKNPFAAMVNSPYPNQTVQAPFAPGQYPIPGNNFTGTAPDWRENASRLDPDAAAALRFLQNFQKTQTPQAGGADFASILAFLQNLKKGSY